MRRPIGNGNRTEWMGCTPDAALIWARKQAKRVSRSDVPEAWSAPHAVLEAARVLLPLLKRRPKCDERLVRRAAGLRGQHGQLLEPEVDQGAGDVLAKLPKRKSSAKSIVSISSGQRHKYESLVGSLVNAS